MQGRDEDDNDDGLQASILSPEIVTHSLSPREHMCRHQQIPQILDLFFETSFNFLI